MSSVVQAIRLSILCAATVTALTLGPTDDIVSAIEGTSDSEVNLESGSYILSRPIVLDRPMSIIGDENGDTLISVGSGIESFIETTLYNEIKLQYITLNSGLGLCSFNEPLALTGQFQIDVIDPDMRDGELKILSDLGPWYNTRILEDFHIQDCSLSRDMVGNPGREAIASPSVYIRPDCRFQIENRIKFQKIGTCGVLRRKEGTVNSYFIKLEASMTEYVTTVYGDTKLRVPLNREGNAVTYISAQIDTQSSVQASISALYQRFSVDCAIIRLERPAINKDPVDDWTEVVVQCQIPSPYVLIAGEEITVPAAPYDVIPGPNPTPGYIPPPLTDVPGALITHAIYAPTGAALSDVVVKLYNGKNDLVETMATDVSGQATFFGLQTGTYRVVAPTDVASTTFGDNMLVGDPDDLVDGETFVFVTNGQLTDAGVFPYAAPGDISGTLTSGAFNSPMLSMKVTLMDAEGSIVAVTQTNSNGGYSFSGIDQSTSYTVLVDVKGNNGHYLDDEPFRGDDLLDGVFGVDLTLEKPSVGNVDYHYSNPYSVSKPTSIITGTVAVTTNGNELERLPVTLVDISSGQIITTTTTDDNGNFEFTDIPVGTYYVEVPENNPNDPNQVVTTGLRNPIVVTGGGDATDVLIGYSPLGVITGDVRDTLGNMIPGVDVVLTYPNTQVSVTKVTDEEGRYSFTGLTDLGNYIVTIEVPAEYTIFDDELDSNADPIDGDSTVKYMGTSVSDVDFVLVSGDSVVGTVVDADGNGVSGVMVTLVGTGEDATGQVAYTNGDGAYTFVSVADGGYVVGVSDSPTVEIVAGGGEATVVEPFVHTPTPSNYAVTITGTIQQAGDLIPIDSGVVLELYDAQGTLVATATTDASGNYVFEDVNPGMYTIKTDTILPGADGNLLMTDDPDGSIDGEVTVIANGYDVILPPFLFAPETLVTPTNDFYDNITRWTSLNDECVDNSEGGVCTMDMQFDVKDCDMTGLYTLMNMEIACSPDAAASGACPKITDPFMNVIVSVQTNDLCEEQQFKIEGAFEPDILLKTDATYAVERPNNRFTLGEMTYWSLRLWTNVTGITIEDANIIKLVRESDGDCEGLGYNPYPFTKDVSLLAQRFAGVNEIVPPEIQTPIRITSGLACAESDNTFNIIDLNFTIRVEYLDGSGISGVLARRRRRDMFKALSPRQVDNGFVTGERWVASDVGVVYDIDTFLNALKLDDIVKGNSMVTQKKASLADSTTLAVFVGGAIALLTGMCCCCCMLAACLLLRKRRQKKREEAVKVIDGTSANFSSTIGSTITFNNISSVGGSYLDRKKSLVPASRGLSNPISNEFVSQEQWIQQPVAMLPDPSVSGGDDVASQLPTIQRSSSRQAQQRPSMTNSPRRTSVAMNPSSVSQEQWIQQPVAMLPDPSVSGGEDVTSQLPTIQSSSSRQAQQRPSMTNSPRRTSVATNSSRRTSVATHSSRRPSVSTNTSAKPVSVTNSPVLSRSSVDSPRGNSRAGRTVLKGSVAPEREDSDS